MTVAELIELLKTAAPNARVILSKDSEGNRFSPAEDYCPGWYVPTSTYYGEFYDKEADMQEEGAVGGVPAFLLWPVN